MITITLTDRVQQSTREAHALRVSNYRVISSLLENAAQHVQSPHCQSRNSKTFENRVFYIASYKSSFIIRIRLTQLSAEKEYKLPAFISKLILLSQTLKKSQKKMN